MTNYVSRIATPNGTQAIGGTAFDGDHIINKVSLMNAVTIAGNERVHISLEEYLPDDGHDYMIKLECQNQTGAVKNNLFQCHLISGYSEDDTYQTDGFYAYGGMGITRYTAIEVSGHYVELPIFSSDRTLTVYNYGGVGNSIFNITLLGYTRIGDNGKEENYIERIRTLNDDLRVGGDVISGKPTLDAVSVSGVMTLKAGATRTFDLASYIPDDGYDYLCYFNCTIANTQSNPAGTNNKVYICPGATDNDNRLPVFSTYYRATTVERRAGGNVTLVLSASDRNVTVSNHGSSQAYAMQVYLRAIRRLGTSRNDDNVIAKINDVPIGGSAADGPWVAKTACIFATSQLSTSNKVENLTMSNYLPTNNELYELKYISTGYTWREIEDKCQYWLTGNGLGTTYMVGCYLNSAASGTNGDTNTGSLFGIQDSSGKMTFTRNHTSGQATTSCSAYLVAYRKIGKNI